MFEAFVPLLNVIFAYGAIGHAESSVWFNFSITRFFAKLDAISLVVILREKKNLTKIRERTRPTDAKIFT